MDGPLRDRWILRLGKRRGVGLAIPLRHDFQREYLFQQEYVESHPFYAVTLSTVSLTQHEDRHSFFSERQLLLYPFS